jgi:hypothetical protein
VAKRTQAVAIDDRGRSEQLDGSIFGTPNGYAWTVVFENEVIVE